MPASPALALHAPPASEIRCIICNANDPEPLFQPSHSPGPIVRCRQCGMVYVSPRQRPDFLIQDGPRLGNLPPSFLTSRSLPDVAASGSLPAMMEKSREYPIARRNHLLALQKIHAYRSPPGSLLDFGCEGGFFLETARQAGWNVQGLEPRPGPAIFARANFNIQVLTDTIRQDSFPLDSFDVITAFQVFEHLANPQDDLNILRSFLKPGGVILVEVPEIETWSVRLFGRFHRHFVWDHYFFFSSHTLQRLFKQTGLIPLEVYHPARTMTLRQMSDWVGRLFSSRLSHLLTEAFIKTKIANAQARISLGDILAVIGRKA